MGPVKFEFRVKNYRCFGNEYVGFDQLMPINVIIGRNNSGKSALLDLVRSLCTPKPKLDTADAPTGTAPQFQMALEIPLETAKSVFPENTSGGGIRAGNHWQLGQRYIGRRIVWEQPNGGDRSSRQPNALTEDLAHAYQNQSAQEAAERRLASAVEVPLHGRLFTRLSAERDVVAELDSASALQPQENGANVTNLIQRIYNEATQDRALVEEQLLDHLNKIVGPDYKFDEIVPRRFENGTWGIYLRESAKGLVPLSASGSGLKTVLCVLSLLLLWPRASKRPELSDYVFGLEELENSLHPALVRRLFDYVARRIVDEGSYVFFTTHSSVAIDMFSTNEHAQIVHTSHLPSGRSIVTPVSEYLHRRAVLHDLDVRASDLLQSNGIIWVEGPSDRTYINHWISLVTQGGLREGTHYQCVFYGGRLLAHLSADDPEAVSDAISILRVNVNAAVLIDSDKKQGDTDINDTKRRLAAEVRQLGGISWITAGREIENYLPTSAIDHAMGVRSRSLGQYEDIRDVLEEAEQGAGRRFERSKTSFASKAVEQILIADQKDILDWNARIHELCEVIYSWNRMAAPSPALPVS